MKPGNFQRGVSKNPHDRTAGDAPNLGEVSRISKRNTRLASGNKSRSSGNPRAAPQRRPLIGKLYLAIGLLVMAGLIFTIVQIMGTSTRDNKAVVDSTKLEAKSPTVKTLAIATIDEDQAIDFTKRALALRDPNGVEEFFTLGQSQPQEIIDFLKNVEVSDGLFDKFSWINSVDDEGKGLNAVIVSLTKGGRARQRTAIFTQQKDSQWRIDFDALARTSKPSWNEIINEGAAKALVRVVVAPDNYYNGPFKDEKEWTCYAIKSPDADALLFGYCKVGSPQANALAIVMSKESKVFPVTLEITREGGPQSKQFQITRVLAKGWVIRAKALDEKF